MTSEEPTYTIVRTFAGPRDLLWRAWTEPAMLARWFGPKGTQTEVKAHDLRPGGVLHSSMTGPDGSVMWARFDYVAVEPPSLLSWIHGFSDEAGTRQPSPFPGAFPLEMFTTVRFADEGEKTRITLTWQPIAPSEEERAGFIAAMESFDMGWGGSFEQLDALLTAC